MKRYIVNERIRRHEVRVIDEQGQQLGVLPTQEALESAKSKGLDLLLVSPDTQPPVCKIVNFGQYKYEQRKKEKTARKNSKPQTLKELKLSPKISDHDYNVRLTSGRKFLEKGYNVKVSVFFKGRENARKDIGKIVLDRYIEDISELGNTASDMSTGPRSISILISPK